MIWFIWFENLAIFDKLKIDSEALGVELTKKLLVPDTEDLNSGDVVKIDGVFHKIYNVNTVLDKRDSFPKKEITLTSFKEKLNEIVEEG